MDKDEQDKIECDIAMRIERIRACDYSFEGLLRRAAEDERWAAVMENAYEQQDKLLTVLESTLSYVSASLPPLLAKEVAEKITEAKSVSAKTAVEARHNKPGGSREMSADLLAMWMSGMYESRKRCAYEWHEELGMTEGTACKKLQGTPNPDPWPAKKVKKGKT